MEEFIDDIRNLAKVDKFTGGNKNRCAKSNKIIDVCNGLIEAAERAAASGSFKTFDGFICDGGTSVLYEINGKAKA